VVLAQGESVLNKELAFVLLGWELLVNLVEVAEALLM